MGRQRTACAGLRLRIGRSPAQRIHPNSFPSSPTSCLPRRALLLGGSECGAPRRAGTRVHFRTGITSVLPRLVVSGWRSARARIGAPIVALSRTQQAPPGLSLGGSFHVIASAQIWRPGASSCVVERGGSPYTDCRER